MLSDGFHDVPPGKLATVVTHLEMRAPAPLRPNPDLGAITFGVVTDPAVEWYRDIFDRVGAQNWLWFSRLNLSDNELGAILNDPRVQLFTLTKDGRDEALLELDFREAGACELAFFGVTDALIGTGAGRYIMNEAITRAWAEPINHFHVHTCTLDHPAALAFYRRSGFTPIRQQIEIAPDVRLTGQLPRSAGPHVPIFD